MRSSILPYGVADNAENFSGKFFEATFHMRIGDRLRGGRGTYFWTDSPAIGKGSTPSPFFEALKNARKGALKTTTHKCKARGHIAQHKTYAPSLMPHFSTSKYTKQGQTGHKGIRF